MTQSPSNKKPKCHRLGFSDPVPDKHPSINKLLSDNRQLLVDLIENSGPLIVIKDREGKYLLVNRRWEEVTGLKRENVLGKTDAMLFPPEMARQFRENDLQVIESESAIETEERLETPSGTRYFISSKFPFISDGGAVAGIYGVISEVTDLTRTKAALQQSQQKYQSLFKDAQVALYRTGIDGKLLEINQRYAEMAGYASVDQCMREFNSSNAWVNPKERAELMRILRERRSVSDYEAEIIRKDGKHIWILFSATIYPEQGYVEGSIVDISDIKRTELALKKSEAFQRKMVANIGDVITIITSNGINRYKSPNMEKMFGWKPEDLVGASTWDNIHPEDLAPAQKFFESLMQKPHGVGTIELRYKCKDGTFKWIEFTGSNLSDDPDIQGILGNYHDIMERKRAEKELLESEARFKALHNASFGGIAIHDKGIILECNQGLSEMTGYSVFELMGMDGLLLISEKSRNSVMQNILSGYEKPYEAIGLRKDGTEYPIRLEARNIPYKGKPVRTVEFRDISETKHAEKERKKLQDQLTQAQKMESVGRLAGGVAHDYNNMLSVILGYTELAMGKVSSTDSLYENLQEIYKAAKRSSEITGQLLAFARKQPILPKTLDINTVIESMLNMLRRLIGEEIEINWHPGRRLSPVKMDPSQFEQILANLCVNARDAIIGSGKIIIETQMVTINETNCSGEVGNIHGEFVKLSVKDDGCGMEKETLDNIFEPFFTTKDVSQGTGLGLATVYGIVKQNNGFIKVFSEPGNGASFNIYLPRHFGKTAELSSKKVLDTPSGDGEVVLLVEDEPAIREMCRAILAQLGYQVMPAATPKEALGIAVEHQGRIDLLVTDVVMPGMNGLELTRQLKALHPEIKTLFMSGYTADVIAHRGVLEEEVQFIQKPFAVRELGIKIKETLTIT